MKKKAWATILLLASILPCILIVVNVNAQQDLFPRRPPDINPEDIPEIRKRLDAYFLGRTVTSVINSLLLSYLLYIYIGIYRKIRSHFTLCLVIMAVALLLFSLSSTPLIQWALGDWKLFGVFNFFPDVFTTLAAIVLIYLSRQ